MRAYCADHPQENIRGNLVYMSRWSQLYYLIFHFGVSYVDDIVGYIGFILVYLNVSIGTSLLNMVAVVEILNVG